MKKKSGVKANYIYNTIYQILLIITPLITSPYVSRTLGSEGLGIFSYTYSVANCFALVGMLGVTNYGNRTIAAVQDDKKKRSKAFWNIFTLQILTTLFVLFLYIVYIITLSSLMYRTVSIIQIMTVLCSLCDINWYFFGVEKFKLTVTRNIIIKVLNVIMIFLFVHDGDDVGIYSAIIVGSLLLSNLAVWPFLRQEVDFVKPELKEAMSHFSQILILFIPVIAITLYKRMDKIMIGAMSTMNQTGFYENTEKIINIPNSLIAALGTVMLPRMSYLFAHGEKKHANKYITNSMEFICFLASILMFGVAGVALEFVPWFFGSEFKSIGIMIIAISPTIIFVSWANVIRTQYLIPLHKDKIYVASVWMGAIINLVLNAILIPKYGAMGAVVGTVVAEGTVATYQTISVFNELPIMAYLKNGIYYLFSGLIMFIAMRIIGKMGYQGLKVIILEGVIGGVIFIILCVPYVIKKHREMISLLLGKIKGKVNRGK